VTDGADVDAAEHNTQQLCGQCINTCDLKRCQVGCFKASPWAQCSHNTLLMCIAARADLQVTRKVNGSDLFVFDIASDKRHYLSSIGKKGDTVFALVVTAPSSAYERDYDALKHIQDTFQLL
jgi:hypothetical protein